MAGRRGKVGGVGVWGRWLALGSLGGGVGIEESDVDGGV